MPPKTIATAKQVEAEFKKHCKEAGMTYVPYDQSRLAKKSGNRHNADLAGGRRAT